MIVNTLNYQGEHHNQGEHLAAGNVVDPNNAFHDRVLQRSQQPVSGHSKKKVRRQVVQLKDRGTRAGLEGRQNTRECDRKEAKWKVAESTTPPLEGPTLGNESKTWVGGMCVKAELGMSANVSVFRLERRRCDVQNQTKSCGEFVLCYMDLTTTDTPLSRRQRRVPPSTTRNGQAAAMIRSFSHPPMIQNSVPASHATRNISEAGRSPYKLVKTRVIKPGLTSSPVPPIFCHFSDARYGRPAASTSAETRGALGAECSPASKTMEAVAEGSVPGVPTAHKTSRTGEGRKGWQGTNA